MLWTKRDMGSDPINPTLVTTDIPTVNLGADVAITIPVAAYKRLADWASMGRTTDNVCSVLAAGSPDTSQCRVAYDEMEALKPALDAIHHAVRQHYIGLPHTLPISEADGKFYFTLPGGSRVGPYDTLREANKKYLEAMHG